jgi:hypothetical protein
MELTTTSLTAKVCDDTDLEKLHTALSELGNLVTYTDGEGHSIRYSPVREFSFTTDGTLKIEFQYMSKTISK